MPVYEYRCLPNNHRFEVRQSMSEDPVAICPECGGPVRRVIHPVGIVFKGSGFYVTDSRKPAAETKSTSETKSATGGEGAKSSTSESKGSGSAGETKSGSAS